MGVVRHLTHNPLIEQGKFINFRKLCNKITTKQLSSACIVPYITNYYYIYIYMELRIVIFRYSSAQLYFGNSEMRGIK